MITGFEKYETSVLTKIHANLGQTLAKIAAMPTEERFVANARGAVPAESALIWAALAQNIESVLAQREGTQ